MFTIGFMDRDISPPVDMDRFSGFADTYDSYRPRLPEVVADVLCQMAGASRPKLVVDIGCGTGLSTALWLGRADRVVGIEPNPDMRLQAEKQASGFRGPGSVVFQDGLSTETGLPDGSVDIVTCCQSLHWMEPGSTFKEIGRILRPGGIFAACDCDWPPTINVEAETAFRAFRKRVSETAKRLQIPETRRWTKEGHLDRMKQSGQFSYTKELLVHSAEIGNADRLVGLALSFGSTQKVLKQSASDKEIGLDALRQQAMDALGNEPSRWYFHYRVRVGIH